MKHKYKKGAPIEAFFNNIYLKHAVIDTKQSFISKEGTFVNAYVVAHQSKTQQKMKSIVFYKEILGLDQNGLEIQILNEKIQEKLNALIEEVSKKKTKS